MFDTERIGLPPGIESTVPGPELAQVLADVDRERLSGYDRVELLKARARQAAHDQAELYADIEAVSEAIGELYDVTDLEEMFHTTSSEIRAALTLTRRAAEVQVDLAFELRERLPQVWVALHEGRIDLARARVICDQTIHLPRETARDAADTILLTASGQTTGQLRAALAKLVISIDPAAAEERHRRRLIERRVVVERAPDDTADISGLRLPPADANAAMRRINRLARAARRRGDPRTIDQIRADIFLDLLTGRHQQNRTGGDRGVVDITVDLTTLAGLDEQPGEIPGWGPVIADVARQVAEEQQNSEWRITITDGDGQPKAVTTTRRRPTTAQRRAVEARNPTCVFPGCRMPARRSDLDHEHPWAQTHRTSTRYLEPLCRHDHINRHQRHWRVQQMRPGVFQLTSPLGHTYTTRPEPP